MSLHPAPPLTTAEIGRLDADLPCVACQYNLRHQPAEGVCPECATPIERSLRWPLLMHSDRGWVQKLATGVFLLTASASIGLAANIGNLIAQRITAIATISSVCRLVQETLFVAGAMVASLGEPRRPYTPRVRRRVGTLRIVVGAGGVTAVLSFLVGIQVLPRWLLPSGASYVLCLYLPVVVLQSLATFLTLGQQQRLAMGVPAPRLARSTGCVRWLVLIESLTAGGMIAAIILGHYLNGWRYGESFDVVFTTIGLAAPVMDGLVLYVSWKLMAQLRVLVGNMPTSGRS